MYIHSLGYEYHPDVKTWTLFRNGNVLMKSATIEFPSSGLERRPSSTHYGDPIFDEDGVNLIPGPEAARSNGKALGKGEGDLHRLEVMPEYEFCALNDARYPTFPKLTESSSERLNYPGAKHAASSRTVLISFVHASL